MFESFFIFDRKYYKQCDGFNTGTKVANVCTCYFEKTWVESCPTHFKHVASRKYINDTFLEKFKTYLNKQHKISAFTSKIEKKIAYCCF